MTGPCDIESLKKEIELYQDREQWHVCYLAVTK